MSGQPFSDLQVTGLCRAGICHVLPAPTTQEWNLAQPLDSASPLFCAASTPLAHYMQHWTLQASLPPGWAELDSLPPSRLGGVGLPPSPVG
jgi:hypothetical protein